MTDIKYIDTHCHLEEPEFDKDRGEVIERAIGHGVVMITSGISSATWQKVLNISHEYEGVYASIGLDPTLFHDIDLVIDMIKSNVSQIVAIGETGLDHYRVRDHSERDQQKAAFQSLILLAEELKLPIQVHSRSAGKVALQTLYSLDASRVHMHAFDGKASLARTASADYGYYFSIPTSVVRSQQKRKLVKAIDLEHLLLETDSPVLSPTIGERNEPSNIHIACEEVSTILHRSSNEIEELCKRNSLRLYERIRHNS
jgi:TatD DNase family protein